MNEATKDETADAVAGQVQRVVRRHGCILCADGNDLPPDEYCRACGLGEDEARPLETAAPDKLEEAIKSARGGDAQRPFKGYA